MKTLRLLFWSTTQSKRECPGKQELYILKNIHVKKQKRRKINDEKLASTSFQELIHKLMCSWCLCISYYLISGKNKLMQHIVPNT